MYTYYELNTELKKVKNIIKKTNSINSLITKINAFKANHLKKNPGNILLINALNYIMHLDQEISGDFKRSIASRVDKAHTHLINSNNPTIDYVNKKIKNGTKLFVYNHNPTIFDVILSAKESNKEFTLISTESRPLMEGRKLANDLNKLNIPLILYLDCAARLAVKESDIVLIGADNISLSGAVYSKVGAEFISEAAYKNGTPVYICADSWQLNPGNFDMSTANIDKKSIWELHPKNTTINTYAYEKINPNLITGIISDLGIYNPYMFVQQAVRNNPWMFI